MKNQTLADRVCEQIKEDVSNLDESAIHEMLSLIANTEAKSLLVGYLDEGLPLERSYVKRAKWGDFDDVEIDDNAKISQGDNGAWVQAWVWVADQDQERGSA